MNNIYPKDWLDMMWLAYKHYPHQTEEVKQFVLWMYQQYGIVPPKNK